MKHQPKTILIVNKNLAPSPVLGGLFSSSRNGYSLIWLAPNFMLGVTTPPDYGLLSAAFCFLYLRKENSTNPPIFLQNEPNFVQFSSKNKDFPKKRTQNEPNPKPNLGKFGNLEKPVPMCLHPDVFYRDLSGNPISLSFYTDY